MKVVVTGCFGFIGSHFVKHTLETYPEVYVVGLDRLSDARKTERLDDVNSDRFHMHIGDLTGDLSEVFKGAEVIFNFGAKSFVDHSVYSPESFMHSNVAGVFNVLQTIRKLKDKCLLVQVSTDEVYGPARDEAFDENCLLIPTNPYSATKAMGDLLCEAYRRTYKMDILITRCENNFGEFQHPQKVLPVYIKCALSGVKLPVYAPGTQRRKWLYVRDHCDAIWTLVKNNARGVCNIAGGMELENIELARMVMRYLETPFPQDRIEMIDTAVIRPNHDDRYHIKASALDQLNWKPKTDVYEAFDQTIKWYKKNRKWLQI